jgi:hypothetical protein
MNIGRIAAAAAEEIRKGRAPAESPNLQMLAPLLEDEPLYDPLRWYGKGALELRNSALASCEIIAWDESFRPSPH